MKNVIKKILGTIAEFIINNCISLVVATAGLAFIFQGVRLWMRSFFSEYYELTFVFICIAFIAGFIIGSCRRFEETYKRYSKKFEDKKNADQREVTRFKHLPRSFKDRIYNVQTNGYEVIETYTPERLKEVMLDYEIPATNECHYFEIENLTSISAKVTFKPLTIALLKKHPELLDCVREYDDVEE